MERTDLTLAQTVLDAIADSILVCDDGGVVVFANPAARRFFGQYGSPPEGQPLAQCLSIFKPEGRRELQNHLHTLRTALPDAAEHPEIILETETQVVSVHTAAMPPAASARNLWLVLVLRDVTRPFQATKSKSDFVSMVSHELRTPMTSIKGYISLLRQGIAGPLLPKQENFLDIVQRNVDRMTTLINDLLDVSRIEAGKIQLDIQETRIADLAKRVVETMQVNANQKGLILTLDIPPNLPPVKTDWRRITQVFTNLIGNAIAYTPSGEVRVSVQKVPDAVQVSVQDTGIGIAPEDMNHIFERFYRAENEVVRAVGGTGLGLPIVKSFVEMHGGRIWVESTPGEGSTFTFILPLDHNDE